ncbi:MAG: PEP-CTERM sorting domain-containing protein, partial [bacterium]|nr:PEP-CTERM sorting domain-containing protein [bacterium]
DDFTLASSDRLNYVYPDIEGNIFGFRVASDVPEPCSLVLLSLGGLMLLKRRR